MLLKFDGNLIYIKARKKNNLYTCFAAVKIFGVLKIKEKNLGGTVIFGPSNKII